MTDNNKRTEVYLQAPEEIQQLYSSIELARSLKKITDGHSDAEKEILIHLVGDTILSFNKIADMPRLFQQKLSMSADESQRITSSLIELLAPVVRREEEQARAKRDSLKDLAQTFAQPTIPAVPQSAEPEPNAEIDAVEPIRTMEGDINRIHGYGSYPTTNEDDSAAEQETPRG